MIASNKKLSTISRYYPHHYAPYMSDVKNFKDMVITFDKGTPFLPFEQLMAVLPAASRELLPPTYQVQNRVVISLCVYTKIT